MIIIAFNFHLAAASESFNIYEIDTNQFEMNSNWIECDTRQLKCTRSCPFITAVIRIETVAAMLCSEWSHILRSSTPRAVQLESANAVVVVVVVAADTIWNQQTFDGSAMRNTPHAIESHWKRIRMCANYDANNNKFIENNLSASPICIFRP